MRFNKNKILPYSMVTLLLLVALAITRMITWGFADTDVIDVRNAPIPIRTIRDQAHPDGVVILLVDFCKNIDVHGRTRVSFISSSREIFLPAPRMDEKNERLPIGCNFGEDNPIEFPILIPKDTPADKYRIHFRISYDINPLKKNILEEFESQEFEVAD